MKTPNGIILDLRYLVSFSYLSDAELAPLIRALMQYGATGEDTAEMLPERVKPWYYLIQKEIQDDFDAYEEKCRINSENGKKGGRPRKDFSVAKTDGFSEKTEKGNNKGNGNNKNKYNNNDKEEVNNANDKTDRAANALAPRGMVPHSPNAVPPPPPESEREEIEALGIPLAYAEERIERARYFAKREQRSVAEILSEWWESDRQGTPKNRPQSALNDPPSAQKTYDIDEFFQAALERAYEFDVTA